MRITAKHPDAASRCTNCGYNLYGLPNLCCPECGKKIKTAAELEASRWLATRNAPDRQAYHEEILATIVGALLLVSGVIFNILHLVHREFFDGFFWFRLICDAFVCTLAILYTAKKLNNSIDLPILLLGGLWFIVGFCAWFAS